MPNVHGGSTNANPPQFREWQLGQMNGSAVKSAGISASSFSDIKKPSIGSTDEG